MSDPTAAISLFQLDPSIHFLNHGSFGACPNSVFMVYQEWQRRLERQPVLFMGRMYREYEQQARSSLASYLNTAAENLVFVPNATHGVNIVAHSISLKPGDQILASDHEYGACEYIWESVCRETGAEYIAQPIPLPVSSEDEIVDYFWQGVSEKTRIIFLSHISSPTAIRFPVEKICALARKAGIFTVIDGAHAPGQIPVNLDSIGADWYTGNCHKWMFCSKGSAFLYAKPAVQLLTKPRIISWGFHSTAETSSGSQFLDNFIWTGTADPSAYFSVPAGIQFVRDMVHETRREACHQMLWNTIDEICHLVKMDSCYPLDGDLYYQMGIAPLPGGTNLEAVKRRLYDEYKVEVPLIDWKGRKFVRISVQIYNSQDDLDALINGLKVILVLE